MANTPNMNLAPPTVSVTAGPLWATQLNTLISVIDAHNHTSGLGVPVPSAGLNINAALPFNNNDATTIRTARFTDQTNPLTAPTDVGCLYLAGGNLFFNSGAGAAVQITAGAALAGTPGSIGGLVSPAAVTYTPASTMFRFTSNTNVNAQLDIAQLTIRQPIAAANGVTIQSPNALAASYSMTLPTALPAAQRIMTLDNLGAMSFWNIDATALVNNAGTLSVIGVLQYGTNASATIKGNRSAGDTGADVISTSTVTRTAGYIHQFQNNGAALTSVDLNGFIVFHGSSGGLTSIATNGSLTMVGNKAAADAGTDVSTGSTATRTAGYLHQFTNLAAIKAGVGFDGVVHAPNVAITADRLNSLNITSTTFADIAGTGFTAAPGGSPMYDVEYFVYAQNVGTGSGPQFRLSSTAAGTTVYSVFAYGVNNTGGFIGSNMQLASGAVSGVGLLTTGAGAVGFFIIRGTVNNTSGNSGTVTLQVASQTSGQRVDVLNVAMRVRRLDGNFI